MKYGNKKSECCIGEYVMKGGILVWEDSPLPKFDILPVQKPFLYKDGTDGWLYKQDFFIRIGNDVVTIKKTFDYDGASIPKPFWTIIGHPMGVRKMIPAGVHDIGYASHFMKQSALDDLFLELLEAFENSLVVRNACWSAVRSAGWYVYPKKTEELLKYKALVDFQSLPVLKVA